MNTKTEMINIEVACKQLRLPTMRAQAQGISEQARKAGCSYLEFLAELLSAELEDRNERRRIRLIGQAKFPRHKYLADFDFDVIDIQAAQVHSLTNTAFINDARPVVFVGDSGTGKTHLLIGIGIEACNAGMRVKYFQTAALVNELAEAQSKKELSRIIAKTSKVDLLCLDEFGYLHLDPVGAELLFQVITERDERASIAVATNLPFSEWGSIFSDPRLAGAVVDRLTHNAVIIPTGTRSYRLKGGRNKN